MSDIIYRRNVSQPGVLMDQIQNIEGAIRNEERLDKQNYTQILHALNSTVFNLKTKAAHVCTLVSEPLPDDILVKLLSLVPSGNVALDCNAIRAVNICVRDHCQSLGAISIRILCDLVTTRDTHRCVSRDAMMSLLALAEQGAIFEPQHTERLLEFLVDGSSTVVWN